LIKGDQDGAGLVVAGDGDRFPGTHLIEDIRCRMFQLRGGDRGKLLKAGAGTMRCRVRIAHLV
jgi:hypothetical protein